MASSSQLGSLLADTTPDADDDEGAYFLMEYLPHGPPRSSPSAAQELIGDRGHVPSDGFVMFEGCVGPSFANAGPRAERVKGFGRCPVEGCTIPLAPDIPRTQFERGQLQPATDEPAIGACPTHGHVVIVDYRPCGYRIAVVLHEDEVIGRHVLAPHTEASDPTQATTELPHPPGILATRRYVWAAPAPPPGTILREVRPTDFW